MIQSLGQTSNFDIQYEDTIPNAIKRAQALLASVEHEFSIQKSWFAVTDGFGPENRVNVYVDLPDQGGGYNRGYHHNSSSEIHVDAQTLNSNDALAGDIAKMIFVAEISEILMSYLGNWDAGASTGEGLSRFCARERFTTAYDKYTPLQVGIWINAQRENWIDNTDQSDRHDISYNASLFFIYFLRYQLSISIDKIIAAGAPTLEGTFQSLTSQSGGYDTLNNLLNKFFPNSLGIINHPDIFPLLDPAQRQCLISSIMQPKFSNNHRPSQSGSATETFFGCGPRNYSFDIFQMYPEIKLTAKDIGFGQARHRWYVNGVILPQFFTPSVQVPATVYREDLNNPLHMTSSTEMIEVEYELSDQLAETSVTLFIPGVLGRVDLIIAVEAIDQLFRPDLPATSQTQIFLSTEKVVWEDQYYKDAKHCRDKFINTFREVAKPFGFLKREIAIIFTLPDPAPGNPINLQQLEMQFEFLDRAKGHVPNEVIHQIETYIANQVNKMPHLAKKLSVKSH